MNCARIVLAAVSLLAASCAWAFEADVHYGLTQWLALQAGFDELSARTIAIGDQRVDSGDMQYVGPVLAYACVARDELRTGLARDHHYPSDGKLPGAPEQRAVLAGGEAARRPALDVLKVQPGQANYMLFKLGEALHVLQDSWSHQGVPDIPRPAEAVFTCDPTRAWGHPAARGGWNSHKADLTAAWPADTEAMARAVYDILTRYPVLSATARKARGWEELRPLLNGFASAATKTEKSRWFASQGIGDVSFLEGVSLRDGARPFELKWGERKLPPLPALQSRQHFVDADLLEFFNRFFEQWVSARDFDALASAFGSGRPRGPAGAGGKADLAARLKVWRLRDHGRVADIAHSTRPLSGAQRAQIDAVGRERNAYARYDPPASAFFPLLPRGGEYVSPLLPFFVSTETSPDGKDPTAVAVVKFRHLPYDTLSVIAERMDGHWRIVTVVSVVDH